MKTSSRLVRTLDKTDYEDVKWQAKTRRTTIKTLATKCGCSYKQFYRYFKGIDATKVVDVLLQLGYELKETR